MPDSKDRVERVVEIVRERYEIGRDQKGRAFVAPHSGDRIARYLDADDGRLSSELSAAYVEKHEQVVRRTLIAEALHVIEGIAARSAPTSLALRAAKSASGTIYVDLGDESGAFVRIKAGRWSVVRRPKRVRFYRSSLTRALPVPKRGGEIDDLRDFFNVSDETWPLLVGWLVAAFDPTIPRLIAHIEGEAGSGKSTAARYIGELIDPKTVDALSLPRDERSLSLLAENAYLLPFDNVSDIRSNTSDLLSKTVTGSATVRRTLYSNRGVESSSFLRAMTLTSIKIPTLRGDLATRLWRLPTLPLSVHDSAEALDDEFYERRPYLLGAIFDLLSQALRVQVSMSLDVDSRTPDFLKYVMAVGKIFRVGTQVEASVSRMGTAVAQSVVDGHPELATLLKVVDQRGGHVEASASELLLWIREYQDEHEEPRSGPPMAPNALGRLLANSVTQLRVLGIEVREGRDRRGRSWTLDRT